jgi:hypothetical protein
MGARLVLILKAGRSITFDSRSEGISLVQGWFWAFLVFFLWTRGCELVEAD